jgi:hypothetical protein
LGQLGVAAAAQTLPGALAPLPPAGGIGEKAQHKHRNATTQQPPAATTSKHEAAAIHSTKRLTLPVLVDAGLGRLPVSRIAACRQASIVYT